VALIQSLVLDISGATQEWYCSIARNPLQILDVRGKRQAIDLLTDAQRSVLPEVLRDLDWDEMSSYSGMEVVPFANDLGHNERATMV
jgi:hypothetical protein